MLENNLRTPEAPRDASKTRIGDLAAMLRVMRPLNIQLPDPTTGHRRLLADLCRFIGVKVGALPPESLGFTPDPSVIPNVHPPATQAGPVHKDAEFTFDDLPPRQMQTLLLLLDGDSEKQVARKLELSQHTVHSYVKALYRKFGVSSRAELLAKHFKK